MFSAVRRAVTARSTAALSQRRGFAAFGDFLSINPPKISNGFEGAQAFARNKKTVATADDIAKLTITEIPILEAGLAFSFVCGVFACLFTRLDLFLYYKKFGYIYQDGLDVYNVFSSNHIKTPIEGLAK